MKAKLLALFFLTFGKVFAGTGGHSDDYLVFLVPLVFITLVITVREVKIRLKERKERLENEAAKSIQGDSIREDI